MCRVPVAPNLYPKGFALFFANYYLSLPVLSHWDLGMRSRGTDNWAPLMRSIPPHLCQQPTCSTRQARAHTRATLFTYGQGPGPARPRAGVSAWICMDLHGFAQRS